MKLPGPWRYLSHMQAGLRRLLIAVALILLSLFFYLSTNDFQRRVQARVTTALEKATGARVEIKSFHFSLRAQELQFHGLKLRSREMPDPVFFEAETLLAGLRFRSFWVGELELRHLRVQRPHIHVVTDAQGHTNIPRPGVDDPRRSPLDPLFDLTIGQLEVLDGDLLWNDFRQRFDFTIHEATTALRYEPARDRYLGSVGVKAANLKLSGKPLPASARIRVVIERRRMDVEDLEILLPHSRLQAKGWVQDWRSPVITGIYDAAVDLAEAGAWLGTDVLHSGLFRVKGSGRFEVVTGAYQAQGQAALEKGNVLSFQDMTASAPFQVSGGVINFAPLEMALLGGRAHGKMKVEKTAQDPRYTISGALEGISLPRLVESLQPLLDTRLDKVRFAAALNGDVSVSFGGTGGVQVDARGDLAAPPTAPAGYLPVHGRLDFLYDGRSRRLALRNTTLETPASRITVDGEGRYNVTLESSRLAELSGLVAVPIDVQGRAKFTGVVQGPLQAPTLDGRAELEKFSYRDHVFDSFQGQVRYAPDRLEVKDGTLRQGEGVLTASASLPLEKDALAEDKPLTASFQVRGVQLKEIQELAGTNYPLKGQVQASLVAAGTRRNPALRGAVEITSGEAWGQTFDRLYSNIALKDQLLEAQNLSLVRGKGSVTGPVTYHMGTKNYTFQLNARGMLLEEFPSLQHDKLKVSGEADFQVSGSGKADGVPAMKGAWHLQNLVVNGERVGTLNGDVNTDGGRLQVHSGSTLALGRLDLQGSVRLEEPYPLEAKADFTDVDLDSLLQPFAQEGVSAHSLTSGTVTVTGNIRDIDSLDAKATIAKVTIGYRGVDFHSTTPIVATLHKQAIEVQPFHLSGTNIELDASGSLGRPAGTGGGRSIAVKVNGKADLAVANAVSKHVNAGGQATLAMSVEGTTENPQVNGRVDIQEGALTLDFFPNSMSHMKGALQFNKQGIRMDRLAGESGGGQVEFSGSMDYSRAPATFELRCKGTGVRTRYPAGVSTLLDTSWTLAGNTNRALLTGGMVINRLGVNPNFDLAPALAQIKQTSIVVGDESWAGKLDLQFRVVSAGDVRFDSAKTRNLQAQVDLRARGTAADMTVLGKIVLLGGDIDFAGNHYRINRGEIDFNNPFRIDPLLNLDVSTRSQQYDIGLDFSGPMDKLHVNYRSDPPLPVSDIQALLFLGRTPQSFGANAASTNPALQEAVTGNTVLQQAMSATSGKGLDRLFGGARLKFDPQSGGIEQNSSAHLTLEQQVAPDVTLTYITSLNNTQQQIVQVEWAVSPRLSVRAVRDQDGLFGIDLRWKKRFR